MKKSVATPKLKNKLYEILKKKSFHSPFLLPFLPETFPLHLENFGYKKYVIEIGSGWGEFAVQYARNHPDEMVIALEKKKKRVLRSIRLQQEANVKNVRWMIVNVDWFFHEIFAGRSFDKVIINLPDPWPKKRHHKHRFFTKKFLDSLTQVTRTIAHLEFVSDDWPYIEETLYLLESSAHWVNCHSEGVVLKRKKNRIVSFYEKEQKRSGKNVYYIEFKKIARLGL